MCVCVCVCVCVMIYYCDVLCQSSEHLTLIVGRQCICVAAGYHYISPRRTKVAADFVTFDNKIMY